MLFGNELRCKYNRRNIAVRLFERMRDEEGDTGSDMGGKAAAKILWLKEGVTAFGSLPFTGNPLYRGQPKIGARLRHDVL